MAAALNRYLVMYKLINLDASQGFSHRCLCLFFIEAIVSSCSECGEIYGVIAVQGVLVTFPSIDYAVSAVSTDGRCLSEPNAMCSIRKLEI